MRKLLKTGLVIPMLVLALAFTGFAVQAADQAQNDKKELNQDLNRDLNDTGSSASGSSRGELTLDDNDLAVNDDSGPGVTASSEAAGTSSARRGTLERRGRESTKTNVSLASEKDKWWSSSHNNDDEGGDEDPDDEDEGDDEEPCETDCDPV